LCRVLSILQRSALVGTCVVLSACAGTGVASSDPDNLAGDENGGKISTALGPAQSRSMNLVTSHCAKYDKRGFITKMDYDNNTLTFECLKQSRSSR